MKDTKKMATPCPRCGGSTALNDSHDDEPMWVCDGCGLHEDADNESPDND